MSEEHNFNALRVIYGSRGMTSTQKKSVGTKSTPGAVQRV